MRLEAAYRRRFEAACRRAHVEGSSSPFNLGREAKNISRQLRREFIASREADVKPSISFELPRWSDADEKNPEIDLASLSEVQTTLFFGVPQN